jgi:hypothetical protein
LSPFVHGCPTISLDPVFPQASECLPEVTGGIAFDFCQGVSGSSGSIPAPQPYQRLAELCTIIQHVVILHRIPGVQVEFRGRLRMDA